MTANEPKVALARRLGLFDATMLVMGGIIGAGIFINPSVVARQVAAPWAIIAAWLVGGMVALAGAFIYAELATRRPEVGGQYAYLREAFHPLVAFLYGWTLLLVMQSGGLAAVAATFAHYFVELFALALPSWLVASVALACLTAINCLGVRAGSTTQNVLMTLKIGAIFVLIACGLLFAPKAPPEAESVAREASKFKLATDFGAALVPVFFAYGGWQTAGFVAGELRHPERDLPRGLLIGVACVIVIYTTVSFVCLHVLGARGLMVTNTPASEVMRAALGSTGARLIAIGIAISTLGLLSQGMLTVPRVYFAMAEDGLFFRRVREVHPRTRVPVFAILLQGLWAIVIVASGRYEQILNYVVSVDALWFGLTAVALFVFRQRAPAASSSYSVPGHPWTTLFFIAVCWLVVASALYKYPRDGFIGLLVLFAGVPVYFLWQGRRS
ncbi:MAG: amino acid transporter [Pyrinomonas sp.]|uniref:APC family permease n=1 Tax=Pyrinomonas sp. TaxID=2080306 RepID=UPI00332C531E